MYFTSNSRYVLRRGHWKSSAAYFLKRVDKYLSYKIPKDDPTKPPLRINIPKNDSDSSPEFTPDPIRAVKKNSSEGRSKSVASTSIRHPLNTAYNVEFVRKSESDVNLHSITSTDPLQSKQVEASDLSVQNQFNQSSVSERNEKRENEFDEEVQFHRQASVIAEESKNFESNSGQIAQTSSSETQQTLEADKREQNITVVVSVPNDKQTPAENSDDEKAPPFVQENPTLFSKACKTLKQKTNLGKNEMSSLKKAQNFPKTKPSSPRKFEVPEMEDLPSQLLYSNQRRDLHFKGSRVKRVPERELTTRAESNKFTESPIKFLGGFPGSKFRRIVNEVTPVEDVLSFENIPNLKNKPKFSKSCTPSEQKNSLTNYPIDDQSVDANALAKSKSLDEISKPNAADLPSDYLHDPNELTGDEVQNASEVESKPVEGKNYMDIFSQNYESKSMSSEAPQKTAIFLVFSKEQSGVYLNYSKQTTEPQQPENTEPKVQSKPDVLNNSENFSSASEKIEMYDDDGVQIEPTPTAPSKSKNYDKFYNASEELKTKPPKTLQEGEDSPDLAKLESLDSNSKDFQTSGNFVRIGCDKAPNCQMNFGAAFPPLLCKALKIRKKAFGFKREFLFGEKWTSVFDSKPKDFEKGSKLLDKDKAAEYSENSILFPKKESDPLNYCPLFGAQDNVAFNALQKEKDKSQKVCDSGLNLANKRLTETKSRPCVDTLSIMKKVKKIIEFDLDNAVKIFKVDKSDIPEDVVSVVVLEGNTWKVDTKTLERCMEVRRTELGQTFSTVPMEFQEGCMGDGLKDPHRIPKYLPSKHKNNVKIKLEKHLDSVILYNPQTNKFFVNAEALTNAIHKKPKDPLIHIMKTSINENETETVPLELSTKKGDSILVFDEESQTWKVDYSILEKREKIKMEEELTKKSELILETFEELEKSKMSTIPKPKSRDKQTFDYNKEQWKNYNGEKKSKEKCPYKESNAEEIRRRNSDLYENLFITGKKSTTMKGNDNNASRVDSSKPDKNSKSCSSTKPPSSGSGPTKGSDTFPTKPESSKEKKIVPPAKPKELPKNEGHYWETFLNTHISEINKPPPPPPPPPPVSPPVAPPAPKPVPPVVPPLAPTILPTTPKPIPTSQRIPPPGPSPPPKIPPPLRGPVPPTANTPAKVPPPSRAPKIEEPKSKPPLKKIDESRFKFHIPFIGEKKTDISKSKKRTPNKPPKQEDPKKTSLKPAKPEPKTTDSSVKEKSSKKSPSVAPIGDPKKRIEIKEPPKVIQSKDDQKPVKKPPTIGAPNSPLPKVDPNPSGGKIGDPPLSCDKSAANHYTSENIIRISKQTVKEPPQKIKLNKLETVKLYVTPDNKVQSKMSEIHLEKKDEEKLKDSKAKSKSLIDVTKNNAENKTFYKNFEKYKTPFSDPEYEEKSMKIKSDIESNPNLKKLNNWNKTLVLHDVVKPSESVENWLKDETDKMASLLLKVLQEASDEKPQKKQQTSKAKSAEKTQGKGNPYDSIRKKQEKSPENFLFRVRTVNLSLETDKKLKPSEDWKSKKQKDLGKEIPMQTKAPKPTKMVEAVKLISFGKEPVKPSPNPPAVQENSCKIDKKLLENPRLDFETALMSQNLLPLEITEEVPGPELLKKIAVTWKLFPIVSSQVTIFTLLRVFQLVNLGHSFITASNPEKTRAATLSKLFSKYGPVVNVQGPLSGNVVLIHKPEHMNSVFEQDSYVSVRSVFDSLEYVRRDSENSAIPVKHFTDWSKFEWNDLRKACNDPLYVGCKTFYEFAENAGNNLVNNIRKYRNKQNYVSDNFLDKIKLWSLEGLSSVVFEKPFGFLERHTNSRSWVIEPEKLQLSIEDASNALNKCERGLQLWRLMTTPSLVSLSQGYRSISSMLSRQLYQAEIQLKNKNELLKEGNLLLGKDLTFLESMLLNDGVPAEDIICNMVDIMLIGTNVMTSALAFLLYNLSQNVEVQKKLVKELKETLPDKSSRLDYASLSSLKYLQACLKESLRLNMPINMFYRMLQSDILVSNYIIPRGTFVVMDYGVNSMKEQFFEEPEKFMPERWLSDEKWTTVHPFDAFPLCHGPRSEVAKKVIEMQLWACAAKIVRNFQVEYHFDEVKRTTTLISLPDPPLQFSFAERSD